LNPTTIETSKKASKPTSDSLTFKDRVEALLPQIFKDCGKKREKFDQALDLVSKLLKNLIDNPLDDKFR
jgi:hypothetical protein